jgi:hypothetical protein
MTNLIAVSVAMMMASVQPAPSANEATARAPEGTATTRYCLRVDPIIGTRVETIMCNTRQDWADLGLDVDQEWADNGVSIIA